jgi:hypothetical protein
MGMSKTKTVVFDLETMNAITGTAQKWQMEILKNLSGGIPAGTMNVFSAGRQTGKSMLNTYTMKVFKNRYYDTNLCKEIMLPMEPKSKYKFSRAKWHTVDIGMGSWKLGREYNDIIAWCNDTFDPHPKKPDAWSRWWVGVGQIYFRDEQDLVLYKLKWS